MDCTVPVIKTTEEKASKISPCISAEDFKVNNHGNMQSDDAANDPYAYLNRKSFTSEKFKIEIRNLPKYYGLRELRKLLNQKLKLGSSKIKTPSKGSFWIYVCFRSEEDKAKAIEVLNGYKWKGNVLTVCSAQAVPDPFVQKRILAENFPHTSAKRVKHDVGLESDKLKDAVTPFWRLSYESQVNRIPSGIRSIWKVKSVEGKFKKVVTNSKKKTTNWPTQAHPNQSTKMGQYNEGKFTLQLKEKAVVDILKMLGDELIKVNPEITDFIKSQREKYDGLPCEVWPIRYAEPYEGYRNKCEFTIGINESTSKRSIGFRLGSYADGSLSVVSIHEALNVPKIMKDVVCVFENFVCSSELDVFHPETQEGYWRQMTVRYGFRTDELMVIIGIHPQKLTDLELKQLLEEVKNFFVHGEGKSCNVVSLYVELIKKKKFQDEEPVYHHILGKTHIHEKLLNCTFQISPQAFFQINTNAAEVLYNSIGELAHLNKNVTLLDVCCGTGSIGICLSEKCGEVLGLEVSPQAIKDAEENAAANNILNSHFFVGKAEEILSSVAFKASKSDIVAIADPPRAGLHRNALMQLRKSQQINKLVFVSCEPRLALKNFIALGRATSKMYQLEAFVPIKAVPVDLFPHTKHCELLIYFERITPEKLREKMCIEKSFH